MSAEARIDHPSSDDLQKPHELLAFSPKSKLTFFGRKLYLALLARAQQEMHDAGVVPLATHTFKARTADVLKLIGSNSDTFSVTKKYLSELRGQEAVFSDATKDGGETWRSLSLLSEAAVVSAGRGRASEIEWAFPPSITQALFRPGRYVTIDMSIVSSLISYEGLALYEICERYATSPGRVTSRHTAEWWVKALSSKSDRQRPWRKFKSESLKPAIDEINSLTPLEVELVEHREGKAVTAVQFSVKRRTTPPAALARSTMEPVDLTLMQEAVRLGVSESAANALAVDFDEATIRAGLGRLKRKLADEADPNPVRDVSKYLRRLCVDLRGALEAQATVREAALPAFPFFKPVDPPPPPVAVGEALKKAQEAKHAAAAAAFDALPAGDQLAFTARALSSDSVPAALKMLAARHVAGARLSPALRGYVLSQFALTM